MTAQPLRAQIAEDAAVLADMAQRIVSNGGEPTYCSEKALLASRAAVRILGACDSRWQDEMNAANSTASLLVNYEQGFRRAREEASQ